MGNANKIRVMQIISSFEPGGAERMVTHLMLNLDAEKFSSAAISLKGPSGSELETMLAENNIPVWHLDKYLGSGLRLWRGIDKMLVKFQPHVVHTHIYGLYYAFPAFIVRKVPVKVHTIHTLAEKEVHTLAEKKFIFRTYFIHYIAFRCGVVPVAISRCVAESATRLYGIKNMPIIPNGIPVGFYQNPNISREQWRQKERIANEEFVLVCVARLSREKNQTILLKALRKLIDTGKRIRLLLVGEARKDYRFKIEKEISSLRLQDNVRILGTRRDIPEILAAADIFVLPSDFEGNPLSVMEAMAAGKPVICTSVGGIPELIEDGKTGILVKSRDIEALSRAIKYLIDNQAIRDSLAKAATETANHRFDLRSMVRAYENLYVSLLGKS